MAAGEPPVHVNDDRGGMMISMHCRLPGDAEVIGAQLRFVLDTVSVATAGR
jgi:hypothetical protein